MEKNKQKILVFQQNKRGESKIQGILQYGEGLFELETISIDESLPYIVDDATEYLPENFQADMVLDFFSHQDLSYDLAVICRDRNIPVIASGKRLRVKGVITPPT